MSNGDAPATQPPPPSNGGEKPKGCLAALPALVGNLGGSTSIEYKGLVIKAPLGILLAIVVGCVGLYFALILWVIPKQIPFISDPLIEAAITHQVPRPHLVVKGKNLQQKQICVVPKETVRMEIEPKPDNTAAKYIWITTEVELIGTDEWEKEFTAPESARKVVAVQVCEEDLNTGVCGKPVDFMFFTVQEVCPK